jgi:hypothetical protein
MEALLEFLLSIWDYATFVAIFVIVVSALAAAELFGSVSASVSRLRRIALMFLVGGTLGCLPARGHAAGLDCPETGAGAVPNLLTDLQVKLMASGSGVDVANEIDDLINKLQLEKPNISYTDLTDILIAAYCPVVANQANITASEKWRRMRQFETILQQQLAANTMPTGSLIIAHIPLSRDCEPPRHSRRQRPLAVAAIEDKIGPTGHALDLWVERWRRHKATGDMIIVPDDFIIGFQHESDAQRFLDEMRKRLGEFALSLP